MTVLAVAAVVAAGLVGFPPVALGLLALAVERPAADLLVIAAVLAAAMPRQGRRAALLGLPGGVAAAATGSDALVVLLALTAVALATHEPDPEARAHPVLLAAGAWLVLAPTTLPWVGDTGLGPYQAGVVRAGLGAGLFLAVVLLAPRLRSRDEAA